MRRDARFELRYLRQITALDDLSDFVKTRDGRGLFVWNLEFHELTLRSDLRAYLSEQFVHALASLRGDRHGVRVKFV